MHRTDVTVTAVSVVGTGRERPAGLEARAEWVVVSRSSTFAVWTAVAALDRRVTDATVSTDFVATAVGVGETSLVLCTNNNRERERTNTCSVKTDEIRKLQ